MRSPFVLFICFLIFIVLIILCMEWVIINTTPREATWKTQAFSLFQNQKFLEIQKFSN